LTPTTHEPAIVSLPAYRTELKERKGETRQVAAVGAAEHLMTAPALVKFDEEGHAALAIANWWQVGGPKVPQELGQSKE